MRAKWCWGAGTRRTNTSSQQVAGNRTIRRRSGTNIRWESFIVSITPLGWEEARHDKGRQKLVIRLPDCKNTSCLKFPSLIVRCIHIRRWCLKWCHISVELLVASWKNETVTSVVVITAVRDDLTTCVLVEMHNTINTTDLMTWKHDQVYNRQCCAVCAFTQC